MGTAPSANAASRMNARTSSLRFKFSESCNSEDLELAFPVTRSSCEFEISRAARVLAWFVIPTVFSSASPFFRKAACNPSRRTASASTATNRVNGKLMSGPSRPQGSRAKIIVVSKVASANLRFGEGVTTPDWAERRAAFRRPYKEETPWLRWNNARCSPNSLHMNCIWGRAPGARHHALLSFYLQDLDTLGPRQVRKIIAADIRVAVSFGAVRQAADLLIVLRELFSEYPEAGLPVASAPRERHGRRRSGRDEHRSKLSSR